MKRFIFSLFMGLISLGTVYVAMPPTYVIAADYKVNVDRSSAWYDQEKFVFGASVSVDGGAYESIAYRLVTRSDGGFDVYQRKGGDSSPWVYLGIKGADKHDYRFPSQKSVNIFIPVANVCAQTKGYDHMF